MAVTECSSTEVICCTASDHCSSSLSELVRRMTPKSSVAAGLAAVPPSKFTSTRMIAASSITSFWWKSSPNCSKVGSNLLARSLRACAADCAREGEPGLSSGLRLSVCTGPRALDNAQSGANALNTTACFGLPTSSVGSTSYCLPTPRVLLARSPVTAAASTVPTAAVSAQPETCTGSARTVEPFSERRCTSASTSIRASTAPMSASA
mmetsp:Transcript_21125/g.66815  ORF Transcript_21125/g.66815 Transcript_21125/m.66815 type:complete len:208 (+) Transcript_21125:3226-3849(+)